MTTPYLKNVHGVDLGPSTPKPTATTPDLTEATLAVWSSSAEGLETGVWEASEGTFTATRVAFHEVCLILAGRVTITEEGGAPVEFGAGDLIVTPAGWVGVWEVHETLRKIYLLSDAKGPTTIDTLAHR